MTEDIAPPGPEPLRASAESPSGLIDEAGAVAWRHLVGAGFSVIEAERCVGSALHVLCFFASRCGAPRAEVIAAIKGVWRNYRPPVVNEPTEAPPC